MFKDKAIQIKMVRESTPSTHELTTSSATLTPEQITQIASEQVTHAATVIGCVVGGLLVLKTACKIAENVANPANWR